MPKHGKVLSSISAALNARFTVSLTLLCKKIHALAEKNLLNQFRNGQAQYYSAEQSKILENEANNSSPKPVETVLGFPPKQSVQIDSGSGKKDSNRVTTLDSNHDVQVPWENLPPEQNTCIEALGTQSKGFERIWSKKYPGRTGKYREENPNVSTNCKVFRKNGEAGIQSRNRYPEYLSSCSMQIL